MYLAIAVVSMVAASSAAAEDVPQQARPSEGVKIETPGPERELRMVTPAPRSETMAHPEQLYGEIPRAVYDPAFIRPFTIAVEKGDSTGRMGLSGWTQPNTPIGPPVAGAREIPGWLSFGFTWTWGGSRAMP